MKKHDMLNIKSRILRVLTCILLCVAVSVCGRENDIRHASNWPAVEENNIMAIIGRNQIFLLCPPRDLDVQYDDALMEWKAMNYGASYQRFMEIREERREKLNDDTYEMAIVNNALGCLCLDMGKYEEGYEYLNSAYVAMKKLYGASSVLGLTVLSDITYYDFFCIKGMGGYADCWYFGSGR